MAIVIGDIKLLSRGTWRISFVTGILPARIYRDGLLIGYTNNLSWTVHIEPDEFPIFEVLDGSEGEPTRIFPQRATLAFFADPAVRLWLVQERVGSTWVTRKTIRNEGDGYYRWTSRVLEDVTQHRFRVLPVGTNGNTGDPVEFVVLMVRHPDPPQLTFVYNAASQIVTIDQA